MTKESVDDSAGLGKMWEVFHTSRDMNVRSSLVEHYMPLARVVAAKLYRVRSERHVAFDDYLQYARVGLLESVDRFDATRQVSFESYSSHRIRGAILNGLGHESEVAAQGRFWRTRMLDRIESLSFEQVAEGDEATFEELADLTTGVAIGLLLEERRTPVDESAGSNPYATTELDQLTRRLRQLVETLPAREREIIQVHYYEQREFREVAERQGVSKGRIAQLHARAVRILREALDDRSKLDTKL